MRAASGVCVGLFGLFAPLNRVSVFTYTLLHNHIYDRMLESLSFGWRNASQQSFDVRRSKSCVDASTLRLTKARHTSQSRRSSSSSSARPQQAAAAERPAARRRRCPSQPLFRTSPASA